MMVRALADVRMRAWGFVDAVDPSSRRALDRLNQQLSAFYGNEAELRHYWELAEAANKVWTPETHPFHTHLSSLMQPGEAVVDFGCGTAHAARNLTKGVRYVGIEGSTSQVASNRQRFPDQTFIQGDMVADHGLSGTADWAVSFFAIEHCTRPDLLLTRMVDTVKPGGRIAVLCPNFITGMGSVRSGWSGYLKKDKLKRLRLFDLLATVVEERFFWPGRVASVHASAMAFPIYLRPRCLSAPYFSDSDAVYLATESKMADFLAMQDCSIDPVTSEAPRPELRRAIIYLIAQRHG